jgi:hypothetical protein|tara:strand:- start:142 stop:381 length:240 start_codon:yes stop_codon:yes gene_type:complete
MGRNKIYQYETNEELLEVRKKCDREKKLYNYWKNKYNLLLKPEQMEMFNQNKSLIKKALPILDFLKTLDFKEPEIISNL